MLSRAPVCRFQGRVDQNGGGSRPFALDLDAGACSLNAYGLFRPPLAAVALERRRLPAAHGTLFAAPAALLAHARHLNSRGAPHNQSAGAMLDVLDSVSPPRAFCSAREGSFLAPWARDADQDPSAAAPLADAHFEALAARCAHLMAYGRFAAALELAAALQAAARAAALPAPASRLLLLEAAARLGARQHPAAALGPLVQCLATSSGAAFGWAHQHTHAQALVLLAEVHFRLGHAAHAAALCRGALPKVMEHGTADERGKVHQNALRKRNPPTQVPFRLVVHTVVYNCYFFHLRRCYCSPSANSSSSLTSLMTSLLISEGHPRPPRASL